MLPRADPRDAFVSRNYARFGRAAAQRARRYVQLAPAVPKPQIRVCRICRYWMLRGNVETRLRKLDEGQYDAIISPAAGLIRLGLETRISARFDAKTDSRRPARAPSASRSAPTPPRSASALAGLTHRPTWLAVLAERAVSRILGGNCSVPIAAHAVWQGPRLELRGAVGDPDRLDRPLLRAHSAGEAVDAAAAEALGARVAQRPARPGCGRLPRRRRAGEADRAGRAGRRSAGSASFTQTIVAQAAPWVAALLARGIDAVAVPLIEIAPPADPRRCSEAWTGLARSRPGRVRERQCGRALLRRRPAVPAGPPACAPRRPGPGAGREPAGRRACRRRDRRAGGRCVRSSTPSRSGRRLRGSDWQGQARARGARRRRPRLAGRAAREAGATVEARRRPTGGSRRDSGRRGGRLVDAAFAAPAGHVVALQQLAGDRPPRARSTASRSLQGRGPSPRIRASRRARDRLGFAAVHRGAARPRCGGRLHTIDATVNDASSPAAETRKRRPRAGRTAGAARPAAVAPERPDRPAADDRLGRRPGARLARRATGAQQREGARQAPAGKRRSRRRGAAARPPGAGRDARGHGQGRPARGPPRRGRAAARPARGAGAARCRARATRTW